MTLASTPPQPAEPLMQMLVLLNGHCVEQALHVATVLGIADLLIEGVKSSDELASATATHEPSLYRLLRTLASIGIFSEDQNRHFTLTPLGATLRSDVPNSVRDRAIYYGAAEMWAVWGNLRHSIVTGQSAFEDVHDAGFYNYLSQASECRCAVQSLHD